MRKIFQILCASQKVQISKILNFHKIEKACREMKILIQPYDDYFDIWMKYSFQFCGN